MKYIILILIITFSFSLNAQEIEKDGKMYQVKNERVFLDGKDVTETLTLEEKTAILKQARISKKIKLKEKALIDEANALKESEKLQKEKEKAEKSLKKAEKMQKRAEKALKKQLNAQKSLKEATKKLESSQKKYKKLKSKGKLSPKDEAKWLNRINGYKAKIEKAKKKV